MHVLDPWRDALGALSVILAVAGFLIYFWQTLSGEVRPHPLSWFLFGVLSVTGYLVQRDQGAQAGSWALLAMSVICFLLVAVSVIRGERSFSRAEWTFLIAGVFVFAFYLFTKEPTVAAVLITLVDALGYGPTFTRGWTNPQTDARWASIRLSARTNDGRRGFEGLAASPESRRFLAKQPDQWFNDARVDAVAGPGRLRLV